MDRILAAVFIPRVVGVVPLPVRDRHVGLLDPPLDLGEQRLLQRLGGCHDGAGIGVLGFQIGRHLWIVALPQPVVVVDPDDTVRLEARGRHPGAGCRGHCRGR